MDEVPEPNHLPYHADRAACLLLPAPWGFGPLTPAELFTATQPSAPSHGNQGSPRPLQRSDVLLPLQVVSSPSGPHVRPCLAWAFLLPQPVTLCDSWHCCRSHLPHRHVQCVMCSAIHIGDPKESLPSRWGEEDALRHTVNKWPHKPEIPGALLRPHWHSALWPDRGLDPGAGMGSGYQHTGPSTHEPHTTPGCKYYFIASWTSRQLTGPPVYNCLAKKSILGKETGLIKVWIKT